MNRRVRQGLFAMAAGLLPLAPLPAAAAPGLSAGAARVDVTPAVADLPAPFKTIYQKLYARALVLDDGSTRSVLVTIDAPTIAADVEQGLVRQVAAAAHAPVENVLVAATHTHNAVRLDNNPVGGSLPGSAKITAMTSAGVLQAVNQALAVMRPARAGYAAGKAYVAVNRNEWLAAQHRYIDGIDRTGTQPIDHTLGVFKVEALSGEPIAFLLNYGIEPVVEMAAPSEISGDAPGEAERYVEKRFGDKAVALFTVGAAGSPIYRVKATPGQTPADPHVLIAAAGATLGEEAIAASAEIKGNPAMKISGALRQTTCPGKLTTPQNLPNQCAYTADSKLPACVFKDQDADPVALNMGLLKLGDLVLVEADANVTPALWEKLKSASPVKNTVLVALYYGPMHYVMDDAAYPLNTYEATASRAKAGCAEPAFLGGALDMIQQTRR